MGKTESTEIDGVKIIMKKNVYSKAYVGAKGISF